MKSFQFPILLILILFTSACTKEELVVVEPTSEFEFRGVISGYDEAECGCCIGYVLNLTNSDLPYRIQEFNQGFMDTIDSIEFPIVAKFNMTDLDPCSSYRFVNIDSLGIIE